MAADGAADMAADGAAGLVLIERRGPATWLTLNRPEKLNALNGRMLGELRAALRSERDSDSQVLVIAGAGRAFSAGHDVSGSGEEAEVPDDAVDDRNQQAGYIDLFMEIWDHPKPVLTAIQGYCMAGASQMCVFADLNIVAEDAVLSASPVIPLGGGFISPLWAYLVGTQRARMLSYVAGYRISGREAVEWGWAALAVPAAELTAKVQELAETIARTPPSVLRMKKLAINRVLELQGFRTTAYVGAETDALIHQTRAVRSVKASLREMGLAETRRQFNSGELTIEF